MQTDFHKWHVRANAAQRPRARLRLLNEVLESEDVPERIKAKARYAKPRVEELFKNHNEHQERRAENFYQTFVMSIE